MVCTCDLNLKIARMQPLCLVYMATNDDARQVFGGKRSRYIQFTPHTEANGDGSSTRCETILHPSVDSTQWCSPRTE